MDSSEQTPTTAQTVSSSVSEVDGENKKTESGTTYLDVKCH